MHHSSRSKSGSATFRPSASTRFEPNSRIQEDRDDEFVRTVTSRIAPNLPIWLVEGATGRASTAATPGTRPRPRSTGRAFTAAHTTRESKKFYSNSNNRAQTAQEAPTGGSATAVLLHKMSTPAPPLRGMPWLSPRTTSRGGALRVTPMQYAMNRSSASRRQATIDRQGFSNRPVSSGRTRASFNNMFEASRQLVSPSGASTMSASSFGSGRPMTPRRLTKKTTHLLDLLRRKIDQRLSSGPFQLTRAFKMLDKDGSGKIDAAELKLGLASLGLDTDDESVQGLIMACDSDGNGIVDIHEFTKVVMDWKPDCQNSLAFGANMGRNKVNKVKSRSVSKNEAMSIIRSKLLENIPSDAPRYMRQAFRMLDVDQSGLIGRAEFARLLEDHGVTVTDSTLDEVMKVYDSDNSGFISFTEFLRHTMLVSAHELDDEWARAQEEMIVREGQKRSLPASILSLLQDAIVSRLPVVAPSKLRALFKTVDKDGSGAITLGELSELLQKFNVFLSDGELSELMKYLDTDHDGTVDYNEFMGALLTAWKA